MCGHDRMCPVPCVTPLLWYMQFLQSFIMPGIAAVHGLQVGVSCLTALSAALAEYTLWLKTLCAFTLLK